MNITYGLSFATVEGLLTNLDKMLTTLAVKFKLNKEIFNKAPAAVPDVKSVKEDTKISTPQPPLISRRAATGKGTVYTKLRSAEVIETEA